MHYQRVRKFGDPGPAEPLVRAEAEHGTTGMYSNHRCRCDACREAWNSACLARNHAAGRARPRDEYLAELAAQPPPPHGTLARYGKAHRCRCDECRAASARYRREYRAAHREAERAYERERSRLKRARADTVFVGAPNSAETSVRGGGSDT